MFEDHLALKLQEGFQRLRSLRLLEPIPGGARFETEHGILEVIGYAPGILRMRLGRSRQPDYGLIVGASEGPEGGLFSMENGFRVEGKGLALELTTDPMSLRLLREGRPVLSSSTDESIAFELRLPTLAHRQGTWMLALGLTRGEPVYGLGEKFGALNRRGQLCISWNEDATGVNAELSYKNVPFAWSPNGWGLLAHTPGRVTHGVGYAPWSHRSYVLQIEDANLDLFFVSGDTPAEILERYTYLTGRTAIPPRWAYGVWMSRAFYETAEEAEQVAAGLRDRHIPCDVLVLDGRAWHKAETRFDFQWDPKRYPDPAQFVRSLRQQHFRLCLWEYPYVSIHNPLFAELDSRGYLLKDDQGKASIQRWRLWPFKTELPHLQPSGVIDFTHPGAYAWFRDSHRPLFGAGVSVMKCDYGEALPDGAQASNGDCGDRLHNVYSLLYNRCVTEATAAFGEDEPMVWGRAGWVGSQRYPMQWGGDPQSDWDGLAASIRGGLSWGMSGGPFYSHDIGGFTAQMADPELYVRWAQAGLLCSHARFHGRGPREPWAYGEEAERIVRIWLAFRYRLIPYLQACALEAQRTGMPVMRAMPLVFPGQNSAWSFEEQYLLGPSLLVAPVLTPGGNVAYYLPRGGWYNLWSGQRVEGGRLIEETVPLDRIPVFGRQGCALPLGPAVEHTDALAPGLDLEEIWVFGEPENGIQLPGLNVEIERRSGGNRLTGVPPGVFVNQW